MEVIIRDINIPVSYKVSGLLPTLKDMMYMTKTHFFQFK